MLDDVNVVRAGGCRECGGVIAEGGELRGNNAKPARAATTADAEELRVLKVGDSTNTGGVKLTQ